MPKILLVRHGNTQLTRDIRFWGKTDIALSEEGIIQAERLRDRLLTQKIDAAYASSLDRARRTAEIIVSCHGPLEVVTSETLDEIDFGLAEGLTFDEIKKLHPDLARQLMDRSTHPSFPGGENLDEFYARVRKFLVRLKSHRQEETVLVVAHFGTLRILICHLLELGLEHWQQMQISLASLSIIDMYPQGCILSLLNDVSHLKDENQRI